MSTELLERYARVHRKGYDCRLTCSRNVLEYFGHQLSYSTLHGLSGTFFFVYRTTNEPLSRLLFPGGDIGSYFWPISGQQLEVMANVAFLFNALLITNEDESLDAIRPYLAEGIPVMVALCREELMKFRGVDFGESRWFPDGVSFGGHWVVVAGIAMVTRDHEEIDDRRGVAQVFETDQREVLEVPLDVLRHVRSYGDDNPGFLMKSRNQWAVLYPPERIPPFATLARTALHKVVHAMRHPPARQCGIAALEAFCRELPDWCERDDLGPRKLLATVKMLWLSSDLMVGGGMGRHSFGLFLRNAGRTLGADELTRAAESYAAACRAWQRLTREVTREVLETAPPWTFRKPEITDILAELRDAELAGFESVEAFVGRG